MVKRFVVFGLVLVLFWAGTQVALAIGGDPTPIPAYDSINYHDGVVTVTGRLIVVPRLYELPWSFEHRWDGSRWNYGPASGRFHWGLRYQTLAYLNYPIHRCPAIFRYVGAAADAYKAVLDEARMDTFGE